MAVGCHGLSAERRVQGNEKLPTREVKYHSIVQNEISTFCELCRDLGRSRECCLFLTTFQGSVGRSVGGGTKEEEVRDEELE